MKFRPRNRKTNDYKNVWIILHILNYFADVQFQTTHNVCKITMLCFIQIKKKIVFLHCLDEIIESMYYLIQKNKTFYLGTNFN